MIADFTLGLNALVWFAILIMPFYGLITGFRRRRDLLLRACLILLCLVVALLTMEVTLSVTEPVTDGAEHAEARAVLASYRIWVVLGAAGAVGLGWVLHHLITSLRKAR